MRGSGNSCGSMKNCVVFRVIDEFLDSELRVCSIKGLDPSDSRGVFKVVEIQIPEGEGFAEMILYHELVELYTNSHEFALLLELIRYKWKALVWRWRYDKYYIFLLAVLLSSLCILAFLLPIIVHAFVVTFFVMLLAVKDDLINADRFARIIIEKWREWRNEYRKDNQTG